MLFAFVILNILFWFFYYNECHLNHEDKPNNVKPVYAPIYNVPLFHIPLLNNEDMTLFYIEINSGTWCFQFGINLTESKRHKKCECASNWFGLDCGIPVAVWNSSFLQEGKAPHIEIKRRKRPRRVIVSLVIDDQMELLDVNIQNSFSVVDLFLTIQEKTQFPSILKLFKEGYLSSYQSKIIPFQLNKNISKKKHNLSEFMLNELWDISWNRLADFRPDDILLFSHVSSIISKDVLLFLKLYDGFPEPFFFELRPLLFKFWREMKSNDTNSKFVPFKPSGCTYQFIASMCDFQVKRFFSNSCSNKLQQKVNFEKNFWLLKNWSIGNVYAPSGWQCNLCCKNECIKKSIQRQSLIKNHTISLPLKITQANSSVIKDFVNNHSLYGNKNLFFKIIPNNDRFFAPLIVVKNPQYSHMIDFVP